MHTLTRLSALALAALLVSTSLASAGPGGPMNQPVINIPQSIINMPDPNNGNGNNGPQIDTPPIFNFPQQPQPQQPKFPIVPIFNLQSHDRTDHATPAVDCKVKSPLGVSDDIWIINTGDVTLPSGVQINFRVPSTGDHGAFLLPRSLGVGDKIRVRDLLHDAQSGAPCTVKLMV